MRLQRLISALWFGSAVFLMLAAWAAFRAAGHPTVAADVVGSMLTRWHYIALAAPLALFVMELRRARRLMIVLLFTALMLAAAQSFVDLRIRAIRAVSPVPISDLDRTDPVRRRFGMLHGLSMMLLALQAVAAGVVVMKKEELPMSNVEAEQEDTTIYRVLTNDEEEYSIWPADRELPPLGWRDAGFQGSKEECLQYIEKVWTDMRPRSLRDKLASETDDVAAGVVVSAPGASGVMPTQPETAPAPPNASATAEQTADHAPAPMIAPDAEHVNDPKRRAAGVRPSDDAPPEG